MTRPTEYTDCPECGDEGLKLESGTNRVQIDRSAQYKICVTDIGTVFHRQ